MGCAAGEIKVPQPKIESVSPAVKAWSLNHWMAREVPKGTSIFKKTVLRCKTAHCQLYPTTTSSLDLIGIVKSWNVTWSHLTCSICEWKWLFFTLVCPKEKWSNSRFSVLEVEAQNGSSSKRPRYRATWQSQHSMCQFWALILEATETAYQDLSALVCMIPGSFHIWLFMATKDLSSNRVMWHLPSK